MSGSALSAAVWIGDENVFLARGGRLGVADGSDGAGKLGVLEVLESRIFVVFGARGVLLGGAADTLSWDSVAFTGDFLNGERNGFASVWDALSILRRLAAGVYILELS